MTREWNDDDETLKGAVERVAQRCLEAIARDQRRPPGGLLTIREALGSAPGRVAYEVLVTPTAEMRDDGRATEARCFRMVCTELANLVCEVTMLPDGAGTKTGPIDLNTARVGTINPQNGSEIASQLVITGIKPRDEEQFERAVQVVVDEAIAFIAKG